MPKILINEKDNTSPGTPGNYANYSVLIAGYKGTPSTSPDAMIIEPDSNGVYEFSSKQAFEDTIGFTETEVKAGVADITNAAGEVHYGKRMAHALLNLGYTVIYKPIDSVQDMNTEAFWEVFKDKASYDFRFISHGLLETNTDLSAYKALTDRLVEIKEDIAKLQEITETVDKAKNGKAKEEDYEAEYSKYIEDVVNYPERQVVFKDDGSKWFTDGYLQYGTYIIAKEALSEDELGIIPALATQEQKISEEDAKGITPGVFNNINSHITKLARYVVDDKAAIPGRGDCIALIELDKNCYVSATSKPENAIIDGVNNLASSIADDGTYCALTVPSVYYKMSNEAVEFPGAFHYLACFMSSLRAGFAEWYAAAGYTRGVSSYVIDHTAVKLGEIAINALEPRNIVDDPNKVQPAFACNVIANFRGSYYLWGNRTAHKLGAAAGGNDLVAHHFLNIRQLCTTIKKQLYVACRRFTFDPNSDTLWFNFVNAITPTLDMMKADQGIRDYKVLKVFTDKKATLKAKIRIIPIEAVEDFDLEISLEDSFGETSAVVTE